MGLPLREAPPPLVLDPEYDAILDIDDQIIHVCVDRLTSASLTFERMLRPHLRECFGYCQTCRPSTIIVETKYPEALSAIVKTLHFKRIKFKHDDAKLLAQVALLAEQYQLVDTMRPLVEKGFRRMRRTTSGAQIGYLLVALHTVKSENLKIIEAMALYYLPLNFYRTCWGDGELLNLLPAELAAEITDRIRGILKDIPRRCAECPENLRQRSDEQYVVTTTGYCCECGSYDVHTRPDDGVRVCGRCKDEATGPTTWQCTGETRAAELERVMRNKGLSRLASGDDDDGACLDGKSLHMIWLMVNGAFNEIFTRHAMCSARTQCPLSKVVENLLQFIERIHS